MQYSWKDFFEEESPVPLKENVALTERLTPGNYENVYIRNVLFQSFISNEDGGAVNIGWGSCKALIESTSFDSVKTTSGRSGALEISFNSVALSKVCSFGCTVNHNDVTGRYGTFQFCYLGAEETGNITISETTVINSVSELDCDDTVYMYWGDHTVSTTNISSNKCIEYSILSSYPYESSILEFCSFVNNTSKGKGGVILDPYSYSNSKLVLSKSNIIGNKEISIENEASGIIEVTCNCKIDTCSILRNIINENSPYFIMIRPKNDAKLTLVNCITDFGEEKVSENVIITEIPSGEFIVKPYMIHTFKCEAEYTDGSNTVEYGNTGNKHKETAKGNNILIKSYYILIVLISLIN